jgi:PAS domain S-box-containing protein
MSYESNSTGLSIHEPTSGASAVGDDLSALHAIAEGTARRTDEEFFQTLVRHLAEVIDVQYAVVAEFPKGPPLVRTLAFWERDRLANNFEYDFTGTPCAEVVRGGLVHYPTGVSRLFPGATPLVARGIDSYMAVPFMDGASNLLGHLAVFDERPMRADPRRASIFRIFAARATAERERMRAEHRLRDSEARFRDLYENAPNAYLIVGTDGRILDANRRVTEMFGYALEELVGQVIHSFLPDTPAGRSRSKELSRKHLAGEAVAGWELEVRRKDGRPLWVKVWMEPVRGEDGSIQAGRSFFVDITDRVLAEREQARLQEQNRYLLEEIKAVHDFDQIIGQSPALRDVLAHVRRVAPTDASVLITGETGTGKELIARAIHSASKRKDKPLIKVNCAALPGGLLESELFGHEKGAFSGAIARRLGRFELADGGTIFLDEIGELPAEAQVKLLRVLQEREFDRVGGAAPIRADVRVIAATNRDLLTAVQEKTFREDLYYRLNVFPVRLPPLRERTEDIPLLVDSLVNKFSLRIGLHLDGVAKQTMQLLREYPWPGNIRELENVLERAVILTTGAMLEIAPDMLPTPTAALTAEEQPRASMRPWRVRNASDQRPPIAPGSQVVSKASGDDAKRSDTLAAVQQSSLEAVERDHILTVLGQTNWLITGPRGAAKVLGLNPSTLRNRMKKLGITRSSRQIR